jgi:adenylate cyclase
MRAFGKRRSERNPKWCNSCFSFMSAHQGGAEVTCTLLFADIRGSTALAERMSPSEFSRLLDRFYNAATTAVFDNDGMVDKFVGDELVAMFFPLLSGERHASRAIDAARALLLATGHARPEGPWAPVGAGVHTGPVWVGTIGTAGHVELTAVGDSMNTTARLASIAEAGEILVTSAAAEAAVLDTHAPARAIDLKGKTETVEVISVRVPG